MTFNSRLLAAWVSIIFLPVSIGCAKPSLWNQYRADVANTGQTLITAPLRTLTSPVTVSVGKTGIGISPVIGNDGHVFVSISAGASSPGSALVEISGGPAPAIINTKSITGLLSTPAVDDAGSVYVSAFLPGGNARLVALSASFATVFETSIPGHVVTIGPPKLLKLNDQTLIFVVVSGGSPSGGHLFVFNRGGAILRDVWFCGDFESVGGLSGIALNPGHGVAIRKAQSDGKFHIVAAADLCGVRSVLLEAGAGVTDPPVLTLQNFYDDDSDKVFHDPVITADDKVLLVTAHGDTFWIRGYDLATAAEKWKKRLPTWLVDAPALEPFQIVSAYGVLMPGDPTPAQLLKFDLSTGDFGTPIGVENTASSLAIGGQNVFVVTQAGIQVFDLMLAPKAVVTIAGESALAIGTGGEVYGVDVKGILFRLPGS